MILFWWRSPLRAARRAARAGNWTKAALAYRRHLARHPRDAAAWMQLGHGLKEQGDLPGATAAYREAVRIAPDVADSWIHLSFLERGDREAALTALDRAIAADGGSPAAITAMLALGARARLPAAIAQRIEVEEGAYARSRYAAWREMQSAPVAPLSTPVPPAGVLLSNVGQMDVLVVIDGRGATPGMIALTCATLGAAPCMILTDDVSAAVPTAGHAVEQGASADGYGYGAAVASHANQPPGPADANHIALSASAGRGSTAMAAGTAGVAGDALAGVSAIDGDGVVASVVPGRVGAGDIIASTHNLLLVEAGTRLLPRAVEILTGVLADTGAGVVYGDHDHWAVENGEVVYREPCFQPMFDPLWFARATVRPPYLLVAAAAVAPHATWRALFAHRLALPVAYAHVPRLLASRPADAPPALSSATESGPPPHDGVKPVENPQTIPGTIQVIVQTRDAPEMLQACIDTVRATADRPDLLDIVIMDNRSILPRTTALLKDWAARGIARTIAHDEPFNWARANNLAAATGDARYFLFINNDVEMMSVGWDTALRDGLALGGVGAMGALLLYPDGLIQHAGVVFSIGAGGPLHEGIGYPPASGPADRWRYPRLAAAVTGAWLAVTRSLFEMVGGFEERLPVGYNDIDFCLRVRAAGQGVMQASHIVAVHRESATRGIAMSPAAREQDEADWAWMRDRWGAALDYDPACNPHWLRIGQPFDGLGTPSEEAVMDWTAASAQGWPWRVTPVVTMGAGWPGDEKRGVLRRSEPITSIGQRSHGIVIDVLSQKRNMVIRWLWRFSARRGASRHPHAARDCSRL